MWQGCECVVFVCEVVVLGGVKRGARQAGQGGGVALPPAWDLHVNGK